MFLHVHKLYPEMIYSLSPQHFCKDDSHGCTLCFQMLRLVGHNGALQGFQDFDFQVTPLLIMETSYSSLKLHFAALRKQ